MTVWHEQGLRLFKVPFSCAVALASFEVFKVAATPQHKTANHGSHTGVVVPSSGAEDGSGSGYGGG